MDLNKYDPPIDPKPLSLWESLFGYDMRNPTYIFAPPMTMAEIMEKRKNYAIYRIMKQPFFAARGITK